MENNARRQFIISRLKQQLENNLPTDESKAGLGSDNGSVIEMIAYQKDLVSEGYMIESKDGGIQPMPNAEKTRHYLELAKTDSSAWSACTAFCSGLLIRGIPLPPPFANFCVSAMRGENTKPGGSGHHKKVANTARNICIVDAINYLIETGVTKTISQNEATEAENSASAIVARLLRECGNPISSISESEDRIQKEADAVYQIWKRHKDHIATRKNELQRIDAYPKG